MSEKRGELEGRRGDHRAQNRPGWHDGGGGVTTLLLLNKHLLCDDETDEVDGDVDCGGVF